MSFVQDSPLFSQGMFTIDQNSTPEQIAAKRARISALMPRYGSARYVGEGLGQLAHGIMSGIQGRKMDKIEKAGREGATASMAGILGGNSAGPMTILGIPPDPMSPSAIGADAMAAIGKDPASTIRQGLIARGMPEHIADGFVMNFQDESGLNPGINEAAPTVPGSRGGFGLAQWTGPRRKALEAYAAQRGAPVSDTNVQLDFLMSELQGPEASAWQQIAGTKDAGQAGAAIVNNFLRPAEEHRAKRAAEYTGGAANTALPQIPSEQLIGLMSNPWLSPEQRQMLTTMFDSQMQAGDPLRQLEVQKAQLELGQLQNPPPPAPPEEYTNRIFMAQQAGLQQGTPEFQNYLLTGELPGASGGGIPEYGLSPVWGTDANGSPVMMQIGKDGTAIPTKLPDGFKADPAFKAYETARAGAEGKAAGEDSALFDSTESKMAGLETVVSELDALAEAATYTGMGQALDFGRAQFGMAPRESAIARAEYIAKVDNQVLPMLRDTFGAAFTVKEGETLRATLGNPDAPPESKKAVLRAFIEQKKRDLAALGKRTGQIAPAPKATTQIDGYTIEAVE